MVFPMVFPWFFHHQARHQLHLPDHLDRAACPRDGLRRRGWAQRAQRAQRAHLGDDDVIQEVNEDRYKVVPPQL